MVRRKGATNIEYRECPLVLSVPTSDFYSAISAAVPPDAQPVPDHAIEEIAPHSGCVFAARQSLRIEAKWRQTGMTKYPESLTRRDPEIAMFQSPCSAPEAGQWTRWAEGAVPRPGPMVALSTERALVA
jgi:hypothetical protein